MKKDNVLEIKINKVNDFWSLVEIVHIDALELQEVIRNSNGVELDFSSSYYNNYEPCMDIFYIYFGDDEGDRKKPFLIENNHLVDLKRKIDLINKKYGTPKKWRALKKEKYYYIDSNMDILGDIELNFEIDDDRYNTGNYFQIKEEAEKAKKEILKVFKTIHKEIDSD